MEFVIEKAHTGVWRNVRAWKQYLNDLPAGRYKVRIENEDQRTISQNSWFHAVLPEIVLGLRAAGYDEVKTPEDAKDVVKAIFFKKQISNGAELIEIVQGTSKTSKLDFTSKAEDIIKWAAEYLGIDIAPPDKQLEVFDNNEYETGGE